MYTLMAFGATAGLRLVPKEQQEATIKAVQALFDATPCFQKSPPTIITGGCV